MTLAIGKYCAGAGFGVPRVREVVMMIPGGTVVTEEFGCERGLYESGGGQPPSSRTG